MTQKYGYLANEEVQDRVKPCSICDDPTPTYSWTDYSGEGYCVRCGTPYQLKWGALKEGEAYPRINIKSESIPILRQYYNETKRGNGLGTFLIWEDYPDQADDRKAFIEWDDKRTQVKLSASLKKDK